MSKVYRVEVLFPVAIELPRGFEQKLTDLVDEVCRIYEAANRDRLMWPFGIGSQITYMPMTAEEEAAGRRIEFDEGCFSIEVAERPRFEHETYMPGDHDWRETMLATVGWGSYLYRQRRQAMPIVMGATARAAGPDE